jgi:hypothetical protein
MIYLYGASGHAKGNIETLELTQETIGGVNGTLILIVY